MTQAPFNVAAPIYEAVLRQPHSGTALSQRFRDDAIVKSVVFPAAQQVAARIKLLPEASKTEIEQAAWISSFAGTVSDLGFYCATNASVRGRGFVMKSGQRLYAKDLVPDYVEEEIGRGVRFEVYEKADRSRKELKGAFVHLTSEGYPIYGHWLVDIIPKAWLYRTCLGETSSWSPRFLLANDTPAFGIDLLAGVFDVPRDRMTFYDLEHEEPQVDQLLVPSLMHNSHLFHPAMVNALAYVRERIVTPAAPSMQPACTPERIYVSRQRFRDRTISTRRLIVNEDVLTYIAEAFGYKVVFPEEMAWPDQVRLFAGARSIIGEGGSGLHNTMFSGAGANVLAMCQSTHVQGTLAALLNQTLFILASSSEERTESGLRYAVDPERFKRAVELLDA